MTERLSKDEYWDQLDPDKLNLEKKDLIDFCNSCIEEWNRSKMENFKYIVAMSLMVSSIKLTPEKVMKVVWRKIVIWFYDLQYKNALAEKDGMLKALRELTGEKDESG